MAAQCDTTSQTNNTLRSGALAPGVALVTGGARGLGNAIAVSFAREGARGVAIIDIQNEETFAQGKAAVEAFGTKVSTSTNHNTLAPA